MQRRRKPQASQQAHPDTAPKSSLPARSAAIFCPNGAAYTSPGQGPPACPAPVQRRRKPQASQQGHPGHCPQIEFARAERGNLLPQRGSIYQPRARPAGSSRHSATTAGQAGGPPPWVPGSIRSPPSHALRAHGRGEGGWASTIGPRIPWGMPGRRRGRRCQPSRPPSLRRVRRVALLKRASRPGARRPARKPQASQQGPVFLLWISKNCGIGSCR